MGYQRKRLVIRIITTIIVGIFALMFIFPFLWMLSTSFKYEIDVMEFPVHLIPQRWNFQNYVTVFTKSNFHYDHWRAVYHHYGSICLCKIKIQGKENFIYGVSVNYDGTGTGFVASKVYLFSKHAHYQYPSGIDPSRSVFSIWGIVNASGIYADPL